MHRIELTEGTANNKKHFFISVYPPQNQSSSQALPTNVHQNVVPQIEVGTSTSVYVSECQGDCTPQGKYVGMVQGRYIATAYFNDHGKDR